jgi:hypothetical protein
VLELVAKPYVTFFNAGVFEDAVLADGAVVRVFHGFWAGYTHREREI